MTSSTHPARMPQPLPHFSLSSNMHQSTITIGEWTITSTKKPILNGKEIEAAEKSLNLPLPEMTFGNNSLHLAYRPSSASASSSGTRLPAGTDKDAKQEQLAEEPSTELHFSALDSLSRVAVGEGWEERVGGGVLVSMAESWSKKRSSPSLLSDTPLPAKPVKPHDWTYSSCHPGSVAGPSTFRPSPTHAIPLALLSRQDPVLDQILYYADVPLFEDELHDNGESILNVRIRVMPHSFFILQRLFLRVDNVLFRTYDVRIYHAFGSDEIIRETHGMEEGYESIKSKLERPSDLSPLTDPNFVHQAMSASMRQSEAAQAQAQSQNQNQTESEKPSQGGGKPWPGLGKRVEVMKLPPRPSVSGVEVGLDGLKIAG